MPGRFGPHFAFEFQGGRGDGNDWTPPWLRHEHGHRHHHHEHGGPRFFARRFGRGIFGPGGPFGPEGPFSEGRRFFGRGDMKYALLELLQERPMHGYEMMKALEERSSGFYVPSAGSIYPTLQMLEDRGLVTVVEAEGKKVYSITDTGRALLADRKKEEEQFSGWWGPGQGFDPRRRWNSPEMQALRTEAGEVARLFAIAGRSAINNPEQFSRLHTILERTRKDLSDLIYGSSAQGSQSEQKPE